MRMPLPIDRRDPADFQATQPPALAEGMDFAFGPLGVEEVCASMVDTDSMTFESCWRITHRGGVIRVSPAQGPQGSFPAAMATIVHLNHLPGEQIVARKLDPCRWVFAWRIDERRVAVAEANYREPRNEQTDADGALMRLICDTGIRTGQLETAEAVNDHSTTLPPAQRPPERAARVTSAPHAEPATPTPAPRTVGAPAMAVMRTASIPVVPSAPQSTPASRQRARPDRPAAPTNDIPPPAPAASVWSHRMLALAVFSVYAGMAALVALSHRDSTVLQAEAARLQARADATMRQRVDETLASGDYGEVQFELDRLAALKHFNAAAVTNARGRTVAIAGEVPDVRMGNVLPPDVAATGRALPLPTVGGEARLVVWDLERIHPQGALGSSTLVLGLGVCASATAAALLIARRQRRDRQQSSDRDRMPPLAHGRD